MESKDRKSHINIVLSIHVEIERFLLLFTEIVENERGKNNKNLLRVYCKYRF